MLLIYIELSVRLIAEKGGCSPPHNAHFNFSGNKTLLSYRPSHSRECLDPCNNNKQDAWRLFRFDTRGS